MDAAVARALDAYGRLDAAVFSGERQGDLLAQFDVPGPTPATADSVFHDSEDVRELYVSPFDARRATYDMNVLAPMRLFRAALPTFRAGAGGAFVAISGIEGPQPRLCYPLGRYGRLDDFAATGAFLMSDGAGDTTGQTLTVDGGVNRSPGL